MRRSQHSTASASITVELTTLGAMDFSHMAAVINEAVSAVKLLANGEAPRWNPGSKPKAGGRPK